MYICEIRRCIEIIRIMSMELNGFDDLLDNDVVDQNQETDDSNTNDLEQSQEINESIESVESNEQNENHEEDENTPDYSNSSLYTFLQERGIKDPSKIQVTNEDNSVEEIDFNSLTPEEQLEILQEVTDPGLTQEEISVINFLRGNQVTFKQVLEHYAQERLDSYLNEHPEAKHQKVYTIDEYSDDDLYIVDLKSRYPDFTDEEILAQLEEAKGNEERFKKITNSLRTQYKAQEDQAEADRIQQEQQQAEDLRNNLMNAASNFNEVQLDYTDDESDSLVIEDEDKQQMISYILDQDADGKSQLVRDLENPDTLIELAWLRTQGAEVLSSVTKYWKETLAKERAENKKLKAQLEKIDKKNNNSVIIPKIPSKEDIKEVPKAHTAWDNSNLI